MASPSVLETATLNTFPSRESPGGPAAEGVLLVLAGGALLLRGVPVGGQERGRGRGRVALQKVLDAEGCGRGAVVVLLMLVVLQALVQAVQGGGVLQALQDGRRVLLRFSPQFRHARTARVRGRRRGRGCGGGGRCGAEGGQRG